MCYPAIFHGSWGSEAGCLEAVSLHVACCYLAQCVPVPLIFGTVTSFIILLLPPSLLLYYFHHHFYYYRLMITASQVICLFCYYIWFGSGSYAGALMESLAGGP